QRLSFPRESGRRLNVIEFLLRLFLLVHVHRVELFVGFFNQPRGQLGVVQIVGELLTFVNAPAEVIHYGLALGGGLVDVNNRPVRSADRIRILPLGVGKGEAQVVGKALERRLARRGDRLHVRLDCITRLVLYL